MIVKNIVGHILECSNVIHFSTCPLSHPEFQIPYIPYLFINSGDPLRFSIVVKRLSETATGQSEF